ncbi:hypothetical protein AB0C27_09815 [Nonomuraea sp. NPDC048882]|uniref:hypothetical protein n=1 Tax=Nonomuraea sp. NPDC048882 TaxID=3154347 RepID=UPI003403BF4A
MIGENDGLAYAMTFSTGREPIDDFLPKLGGDPVWLEAPQWPLCYRHERPMGFIGQFRLPGERLRMAYLFMGVQCELTFEPDAGENALIVQPGRVPSFIETIPVAVGDSLVGPELLIDLEEVEQAELERWESHLLGEPVWLQHRQYPPGGPWSFFFQLESSMEGVYEVNFGDGGIGYGFLSADEEEGRFLWQC